jgi:CubicO group peptidase (beta-lactamase class C family)
MRDGGTAGRSIDVTLVVTLAMLPSACCETPDRSPGEAERSIEASEHVGREIAEAFLEAYNSGDQTTVRQFMEVHFSAELLAERSRESHMAQYGQLRQLMGPLAADRIIEDGERQVTLVAHSEAGTTDRWIEIGFVLDDETPPRIAALPATLVPAQIAGKRYTDWNDLSDLLEQARSDLGLPAVAAAWVEGATIVEQAAVGVRKTGGNDEVCLEDLFHIGSVTKSMTATMIGRLVEEGVIEWQDTVGSVLGELDMRPEYRPVTLEQLLAHRGRIPPITFLDRPVMERINALAGGPTEQRSAYVAEVLQEQPLAPGVEYSNAGYVVAALMAERRSAATWEQLIQDKVFAPLGMRSAGIGWPATENRPDQPRGHYSEAGGFRPQGIDEYPRGACLSPAGDVHCSIVDLARYGSVHLAGLRGRDSLVKSATIRRLHTPPADGGAPYAGGWSIDRAGDGTEMHWHNGSAGTFYAMVAIFPEDDAVFALTANAGARDVEPVAQKVLTAVRSRWTQDRPPDFQ